MYVRRHFLGNWPKIYFMDLDMYWFTINTRWAAIIWETKIATINAASIRRLGDVLVCTVTSHTKGPRFKFDGKQVVTKLLIRTASAGDTHSLVRTINPTAVYSPLSRYEVA